MDVYSGTWRKKVPCLCCLHISLAKIQQFFCLQCFKKNFQMHLSLGMRTLPKSHPITMIARNHQGCTLDTMVTPWAELIHRTRITSWAELLSAFQAEEFLCGVHLMVQKFYDFSSANSAEMTNFATAK